MQWSPEFLAAINKILWLFSLIWIWFDDWPGCSQYCFFFLFWQFCFQYCLYLAFTWFEFFTITTINFWTWNSEFVLPINFFTTRNWQLHLFFFLEFVCTYSTPNNFVVKYNIGFNLAFHNSHMSYIILLQQIKQHKIISNTPYICMKIQSKKGTSTCIIFNIFELSPNSPKPVCH